MVDFLPSSDKFLPMKLSKKAEYALRAIIAMARSDEGTNFSIQEIAQGEQIPLKFLEQILLALKNGGLLRSKRGVGGGYQLILPPHRIPLGTIITLIDGPFDPLSRQDSSALSDLMTELKARVDDWLTQTTLAHVIERERAQANLSFEI